MNKIQISFAAIDKWAEDNILRNEQKEIKGQKFIQYGEKNIYPQYLHDLVESVTTLKSIINGISTCFKDIKMNITTFEKQINADGETVEDIVRQLIKDYETYGGFALNVVRNKQGSVAGVYNLDFRNLRCDKKNKKFYYSEDWGKKSLGRVTCVEYNAYDPGAKDANSIFYYKNDKYATYPSPCWVGSAISAECLKHIGEFHLNSLYNGLSSDYIINMNNGVPDDTQKEEIEDAFNEKYNGFQNGSRTMISWNPDKEHAATITAVPNSSFIDRYNALEKSAKQDLYSAFNVTPVILGLPSESTGFNDQDVEESFEITKKMAFEPILKIVKQTFEKIFQQPDAITIEVIDIDWSYKKETKKDDLIQ